MESLFEKVIVQGAQATILASNHSDGFDRYAVEIIHGGRKCLVMVQGEGLTNSFDRIFQAICDRQDDEIHGTYDPDYDWVSCQVIDQNELEYYFERVEVVIRKEIELYQQLLAETRNLRREREYDWRGEMPLTVDPKVKQLLREQPGLVGLKMLSSYTKRSSRSCVFHTQDGHAIEVREQHCRGVTNMIVAVQVQLTKRANTKIHILTQTQAGSLQWHLTMQNI